MSTLHANFSVLSLVKRHSIYITVFMLLWALLFTVSQSNFLLFHNIIEGSSIIIDFSIFLVTVHTYRFSYNNFFHFIGIVYGYIAIINFFHALTYTGMGIFQELGWNAAVQLWVMGRLLECTGLLLAFFVTTKSIRIVMLNFILVIITTAALSSILVWDVFPDCVVNGQGFTTFKKVSEIIILLIFLGITATLYKRRTLLDSRVRYSLLHSLLFNIAAEIFFNIKIDVYSLSNITGHLFRLFANILIYRGLFITIVVRPHTKLLDINATLENEIIERRKTEKELRHNRNILNTLLNSIPYPVFWKDRDGVFLGSNDAFTQFIGLDCSKDIVGRTDYDIALLPDNVKQYRADDREVMASNHPKRNIHEEINTLTGQFIVETSKVPLVDNNGDIYGVLGIFTDITERKEREELLQAVYNGLSVGLLIIDSVDFSLLHCNNIAYEILGYSSPEMLPRDIYKLFPSEITDAYHGLVNGNSSIYRFETITCQQANNSLFHADIMLKTAYYKGKPAIIILFTDVSTRKKVWDDLQQSEQRFRDISNAILDCYWELNANGNFTYFSNNVIDILGYSPLELVGKSPLKLFHGRKQKAHLQYLFKKIIPVKLNI